MTEREERQKELRKMTECHSCKAPCRYIYKDTVWCRTCLDNEQYPQYAHLTQEERDANRWKAAMGETKVSLVNAENLKKARIGF